jgi:uncharacterized protein
LSDREAVCHAAEVPADLPGRKRVSEDGQGVPGERVEWSRRPRPNSTPFTEPFWEALREGRLVVQRCSACGVWRWPPQVACPTCLSEEYEWTATAGRGRLYSYSVVRRPVDPARFDVPYVLAVVELDEGPRMLTNIIDCPFDQLRVELPVELRVVAFDDTLNLYPFAPLATTGG